MLRATTLVLAWGIAGCASRPPAPAPTVQSAAAPADSAAVTLERTPCFGSCPVYLVTASSSGAVRFEGKSHVSHPGSAAGRIPKARLDSLLAELEAAGYFDFEEQYAPGSPACGNVATDLPTVITSVSLHGRTKRIEHYRGCADAPQALSRLEERIDEVLNTAPWIGR
ncbi:MAG: DUF6438 domain-containing protein [Gemmatimonadales bacterium]